MIEEIQSVPIGHMPLAEDFLEEVMVGLSKDQKSVPPKYLYDKRGSELFESICLLEEYYPSRAEHAILRLFAKEMAELIGPEALIIEPGSGNCRKVFHLLKHLACPRGYVPIEISREILNKSTADLHEEFPHLKVVPVWADFTHQVELPISIGPVAGKKVMFFPGSSIGNFGPKEAIEFLKHSGDHLGEGGGLIIGADLKKDTQILKRAYDDSQGVTAAFNLNLLERLNREAGATFEASNFGHEAIYDSRLGRIEMHLVSKVPQLVRVHQTVFLFKEGESIHTESSYKYEVEEFIELCARAKLKIQRYWKDPDSLFCVYYFERE